MNITFKDACEAATDESVYVKYAKGLQKVDLAKIMPEWSKRLSTQLSVFKVTQDVRFVIEGSPEDEMVRITFNDDLHTRQHVAYRGFDTIADLVGEHHKIAGKSEAPE